MDTTTILTVLLGSSVILEIVKAILDWLKSKKINLAKLATTVDVLANSQQILMRDRIKWLAKKYISAGEVDIDDLAILEEMYQRYHELGGNGFVDSLMQRVRNLDVKGE